MEDHKVLWDGNTAAPEPPLRRPNRPATAVSTANTQNLQDSVQSLDLSSSFTSSMNLDDSDILSKSNLSVDAEEWFPPNYNRTATADSGRPPRSVQSRLQRYKRQPEQPTSNNHSIDSQNGLVFDETSHDLSKLQEIICTLIEDPGQFDNQLGRFIETLGPYYDDVNVVSNTTKLIVDQALMEPNFSYSAARLCSIIQEQCPMFRSALYLLCEKKVKEVPYDSHLALFLAEIYSRLNYEQLYGRCLIQTLQCVVSLGDGNNVKAVCQVLKLTGSALESNHKDAVDEIFRQLMKVKEMQQPPIKNLVDSVISLRASNWGQNQSSPVAVNNSSYRYQNQESQISNDDPIFYGPDGKELTDEERQFLTDNCLYQSDYPTDDSDPDGLWDPDPEMDEEMQAAFRQFVQLSK